MAEKSSLTLDAADLDFCLYDWLQVDKLTELERYADHSRETFDDVLGLSQQIAEQYFAPHNRAGDLAEPHLVDGRVKLVDEVGPALDALAARIERLRAVTASLWASGEPAQALANATTYLEAAGDVVVGWVFLDQVLALGARDDEFAASKRLTARYFIEHILPRADAQFALLERNDDLLATVDDSLI